MGDLLPGRVGHVRFAKLLAVDIGPAFVRLNPGRRTSFEVRRPFLCLRLAVKGRGSRSVLEDGCGDLRERQHLVDTVQFDRFLGHAEDDRGCFVLRDVEGAGLLHF